MRSSTSKALCTPLCIRGWTVTCVDSLVKCVWVYSVPQFGKWPSLYFLLLALRVCPQAEADSVEEVAVACATWLTAAGRGRTALSKQRAYGQSRFWFRFSNGGVPLRDRIHFGSLEGQEKRKTMMTAGGNSYHKTKVGLLSLYVILLYYWILLLTFWTLFLNVLNQFQLTITWIFCCSYCPLLANRVLCLPWFSSPVEENHNYVIWFKKKGGCVAQSQVPEFS